MKIIILLFAFAVLVGCSKPGPPLSKAEAGTLRLVEMKPDPGCDAWEMYTVCDGTAGRIEGKSTWGSVTYEWTPPPAELGPEGVTIKLHAVEQVPANAPVAAGLN